MDTSNLPKLLRSPHIFELLKHALASKTQGFISFFLKLCVAINVLLLPIGIERTVFIIDTMVLLVLWILDVLIVCSIF